VSTPTRASGRLRLVRMRLFWSIWNIGALRTIQGSKIVTESTASVGVIQDGPPLIGSMISFQDRQWVEKLIALGQLPPAAAWPQIKELLADRDRQSQSMGMKIASGEIEQPWRPQWRGTAEWLMSFAARHGEKPNAPRPLPRCHPDNDSFTYRHVKTGKCEYCQHENNVHDEGGCEVCLILAQTSSVQ
jgi:hypothetical protein